MELWIRSQDKTRLAKITQVKFIDKESDLDDFENVIRGYGIDGYNFRIGIYKSKERALEILDIIQTLLTYSTATVGQLKDAFKDYKELPKVSINSIGVVVYEMPEQ